MKTVNVKFKKLDPNAVIPKYAKRGDAGLDLTATSIEENDMYLEYGTGLSVQIPEGYVGLIYPRSSLSNYDLVLSNHVGVIDSGYRGEIKFRFKKVYREFGSCEGVVYPNVRDFKKYNVGDRVGQLIIMPYPLVLIEEVTELEDSQRGNGGFGSSGV